MNRLMSVASAWLRDIGRIGYVFAVLLILLNLLTTPAAVAAPGKASNLLDQSADFVKVSLGSEINELKFIPDRLEFVSGKRYKLLLTNPSTDKHYFTAKDFADNIWSQKVEAGKVEVKGAIHELELKPGAEAEWLFIPIKPGTYQLRCTRPGHTEAGMVGTITVAGVK